MLALKSVQYGSSGKPERGHEHGRISVVVFDEIDANIGGRLGGVIGGKLRALASGDRSGGGRETAGEPKEMRRRGRRRAARRCSASRTCRRSPRFADRHFCITKRVTGRGASRTTQTTVAALTGDDRVDELAEMLAGPPASAVSRAQASELMATATREAAGGSKMKPAGGAKSSRAGGDVKPVAKIDAASGAKSAGGSSRFAARPDARTAARPQAEPEAKPATKPRRARAAAGKKPRTKAATPKSPKARVAVRKPKAAVVVPSPQNRGPRSEHRRRPSFGEASGRCERSPYVIPIEDHEARSVIVHISGSLTATRKRLRAALRSIHGGHEAKMPAIHLTYGWP